MRDTPPHLKTLEEIEKTGIPGLVEVLREEGLDAIRYVLRDATGWHRDYSPPAWRNWATALASWAYPVRSVWKWCLTFLSGLKCLSLRQTPVVWPYTLRLA